MSTPLSFLIQASETASPVMFNDVLLAIVLLIIALVLLLLEFLVVSYGLLAIAALIFAVSGIVIGFGSSPVVGWSLLGATPVLIAIVTAWGLRRLMRSDLVPKAEITENAGYRNATESLGIRVGTDGVLITDAMPTGRARFQGGEIDVQVDGGAANKGTAVRVVRIEGPTVFVTTATGST